MRCLAILLLASAALAQQVQLSHTTESLRGVSAVSHQIAWVGGSHGTYLRTIDGGRTWIPAQVPDATTLDFRAVAAFSTDEAFLMSAGPGDQSHIYHTTDAGQHWQLQYTNTNPKGFFDSMAFWDAKHGIVLGDPIPDESGKLKFEVLLTDDGRTWKLIPPSQLPEAIDGEGAFAASNSCIAILPPIATLKSGASAPRNPSTSTNSENAPAPNPSGSTNSKNAPVLNSLGGTNGKGTTSSRAVSPPESNGALAPEDAALDPNIWFATGGKVARVFHSADRGKSWQVIDTPIAHGPESAGIFSIAFRDALHGAIAGGDYKHPDQDGPNLAFTEDGGNTWSLSPLHPLAYFSAVAYDRKRNDGASKRQAPAVKKKTIARPTTPERLFIVGQDFLFDFRPSADPRRISPKKDSGMKFNAVSSYPEGGALIVGAKGVIVTIP